MHHGSTEPSGLVFRRRRRRLLLTDSDGGHVKCMICLIRAHSVTDKTVGQQDEEARLTSGDKLHLENMECWSQFVLMLRLYGENGSADDRRS